MLSRFVSTVRGVGLPDLPARVREDIARSQDRSEQIISLVQIAIVLVFGTLFLIAPRPEAGIVFCLLCFAHSNQILSQFWNN